MNSVSGKSMLVAGWLAGSVGWLIDLLRMK